MSKPCSMKSTSIKSPNSPHFWWIISTLGLTIIALVAFVLTNRIACANKIMDYISYASVILSITLSVFALLYTYTSNVQIQQQFEKINSAADNITSASERLKTTTGKLDENLGTILQHLENIDIKQQEISNNINTGLSKTDITNIPKQG